jgi:hypothetical protein
LKRVLPEEIGFDRLEIRPPEVIAVCLSGEFPIDGASGGMMALIQTSWQIFLESSSVDGSFVVLIDEPENHLHPSMQRTFLANIVSAFPDAQFIVATHSPFIVSSVKDSFVYVLTHKGIDGASFKPTEPRSVYSLKVDQSHTAGPATEILRDVLGVPVTIPEWSVDNLNGIANAFSERPLTKESLNELRQMLGSAGLSEFYPQILERIMR